jgi:hypothetical protein
VGEGAAGGIEMELVISAVRAYTEQLSIMYISFLFGYLCCVVRCGEPWLMCQGALPFTVSRGFRFLAFETMK